MRPIELLSYRGGKLIINSVVQKSKKITVNVVPVRAKLQNRFVQFN